MTSSSCRTWGLVDFWAFSVHVMRKNHSLVICLISELIQKGKCQMSSFLLLTFTVTCRLSLNCLARTSFPLLLALIIMVIMVIMVIKVIQALCEEFGERVVPTAVGMTLNF